MKRTCALVGLILLLAGCGSSPGRQPFTVVFVDRATG